MEAICRVVLMSDFHVKREIRFFKLNDIQLSPLSYSHCDCISWRRARLHALFIIFRLLLVRSRWKLISNLLFD